MANRGINATTNYSNSNSTIQLSTDNSYMDFLVDNPTVNGIIICLVGLVTILTICGNTAVLWIFAKCRELRTTTNYFLISLCCADLSTGLISMPVWLTYKILGNRWVFGQTLLHTWRCFDVICGTASIWNLCSISLDRCLAVSAPLKHIVVVTSSKVIFVVFLVWLYSTLVSLIILTSWARKGILITFLSFLIPLLLILISYVQIYLVKTRSKYTIRRSGGTQFRRDVRAAKQMISIIGCFVFSWLGFFILVLLLSYTENLFIHPLISDAAKILTYVNSCINPMLYCYVSRKFRKNFAKILRCKIRRPGRNSSSEWRRSSGGSVLYTSRRCRTEMIREGIDKENEATLEMDLSEFVISSSIDTQSKLETIV